jgi:hypothetical protein
LPGDGANTPIQPSPGSLAASQLADPHPVRPPVDDDLAIFAIADIAAGRADPGLSRILAHRIRDGGGFGVAEVS